MPVLVPPAPQSLTLERLGVAPGGVVLDNRHRRSATFAYRLDRDARGPQWLMVTFRVRVELGPRVSRHALGSVEAFTDRLASASIEMARAPSGSGVRWTAAGLHSGATGVERGRSFRVAYTNYVRTQAAGAGRHELTFRYRSLDGFRLRRATIESGTAIVLSRQPPQALRVRARVEAVPPSLDRVRIKLAVTNIGQRPARHVTFSALPQTPGVAVQRPPAGAPIPPGATASASLEAVGDRSAERRVQVLVASSVGEDVANVVVPSLARGAAVPPASVGRSAGGGDGGSRGALGLGALVAAAAVAGAAQLARRRQRRDG
jgi:hypothetical protein